jgi:hypothetical protein
VPVFEILRDVSARLDRIVTALTWVGPDREWMLSSISEPLHIRPCHLVEPAGCERDASDARMCVLLPAIMRSYRLCRSRSGCTVSQHVNSD